MEAKAVGEIPAACNEVRLKYNNMFLTAQALTGVPVDEFVTLAFIESRVGLGKVRNMFMADTDYLYKTYKPYLGDRAQEIAKYDPEAGAQLEDINERFNRGVKCVAAIKALRFNPLFCAIYTGSRIRDGRVIMANRVGIPAIKPYLGAGLGYMIHNLGENYLADFIRNPTARGADFMSEQDMLNRAMPADITAKSCLLRTAGLYRVINNAIHQHVQTLPLAERPVIPTRFAQNSAHTRG